MKTNELIKSIMGDLGLFLNKDTNLSKKDKQIILNGFKLYYEFIDNLIGSGYKVNCQEITDKTLKECCGF